MMVAKIPDEKRNKIRELFKQGMMQKDIAKDVGVDRATVHHYTRDLAKPRLHPQELKEEVIQRWKQKRYTRPEIARIYNIPLPTVVNWTKDIPGYPYGYHIIRKNGISLLNRLMSDGYLITDFVVSTVRNLQRQFPMIMSARYKDKTFFYLQGREEETIEAFFREKPDRVISYRAIEEMAYLLGVQVSKKDQRNLLEKYKGKHKEYWESRRLIQRSIDDWLDDSIPSEVSFRLMTKT